MANLEPITAARLREVLHYDPGTGVFRWRKHLSNRTKGSRKAGSAHSKGYRRIRIEGRLYFSHRLAWMYVHGRWPVHLIDHINGIRSDNRIVNLREATPDQNESNRGANRNNPTGFKGVHRDKRDGRYYASIMANGVTRRLGGFSSAEAAHNAYIAAAKELHGEFAYCR